MVEEADQMSFDVFFRVEYPRLVAIGRGLTGSHETGCDLAQETLLRCHRGWRKVSMLDRPGAWARHVLVNLARDAHRSAIRRRGGRVVPDHDSSVEFGDPVVDGWWSAVRALPDRQRAVVVLHYLEDLSVTDVAEVLGVAEGTIKATLSKARATLARTLSEEVSS